MAISNTQAAINIINGYAIPAQISSAAENYSKGDNARAIGDIEVP